MVELKRAGKIFHVSTRYIFVNWFTVTLTWHLFFHRYDDLNKMPTLTECWASKAATKQRRGRAGRVKPGEKTTD